MAKWKAAAKKGAPATPKPRVFIGSSAEGLKIAQAIAANLEYVAEADIWTNVFDLSGTTVEGLEKATEEHEFAIFVFTADDEVKYRGAKLKAARDNVLWEHDLFSGKNGRNRTFVVMPRGVKGFKLPTDFLGITTASYDPSRLGSNLKSALQTACFDITQAIEAAIKAKEEASPSPAQSITPPAAQAAQSELRTLATKHVADLLSLMGGGTAGLTIAPSDVQKVKRWTDNVLFMVKDVFRRKQNDAYVTWLRPDSSKPPELVSYATEGAVDVDSHHTFAAGEGLAGKSWAQGKAVGHSPGHPHEWWVIRKGCENNAFLCAPVGPFEGSGGLLGVGSDKGFEVTDDDVEILRMYASLLGFIAHLLPVADSRRGTVPLKAVRSAGARNRSGA